MQSCFAGTVRGVRLVSDFLKGLVIGIGAIAPGVSGGTLAILLGVYEEITEALAHIFTDFKKKVFKYAPMALGIVLGVLVFSRVIHYLFENFEIPVKYLFIGLMVGTFPSLKKQADKQGFRYRYLIIFILSFVVTLLLSKMEGSAVRAVSHARPGLLHTALYGAIVGLGTLLPGISTSFILMYLGVYPVLLEGLSGLDLSVLIPAGIGAVLSILVFAKIINLLFQKAYGYTYYAIFGFTIGSVFSIFPGIGWNWRYLLCVLLLVIGCAFSYRLSSYEPDKQSNK